MTREETKVKTFDILHFVADNAGLSTFEAIEKAYNMGVSEQESVIDKVRAEIEELDRYYDNDYFSSNNCPMYKCDEVLNILDKYRKEQEDNGFFDEIMDDESDGEVYEKIKEIIDKDKE